MRDTTGHQTRSGPKKYRVVNGPLHLPVRIPHRAPRTPASITPAVTLKSQMALNFWPTWAVYSFERTENPMYIDKDLSSNAEALVAFLLVCAIAVVAFI